MRIWTKIMNNIKKYAHQISLSCNFHAPTVVTICSKPFSRTIKVTNKNSWLQVLRNNKNIWKINIGTQRRQTLILIYTIFQLKVSIIMWVFFFHFKFFPAKFLFIYFIHKLINFTYKKITVHFYFKLNIRTYAYIRMFYVTSSFDIESG